MAGELFVEVWVLESERGEIHILLVRIRGLCHRLREGRKSKMPGELAYICRMIADEEQLSKHLRPNISREIKCILQYSSRVQ